MTDRCACLDSDGRLGVERTKSICKKALLDRVRGRHEMCIVQRLLTLFTLVGTFDIFVAAIGTRNH